MENVDLERFIGGALHCYNEMGSPSVQIWSIANNIKNKKINFSLGGI